MLIDFPYLLIKFNQMILKYLFHNQEDVGNVPLDWVDIFHLHHIQIDKTFLINLCLEIDDKIFLVLNELLKYMMNNIFIMYCSYASQFIYPYLISFKQSLHIIFLLNIKGTSDKI